MNKTTALVFFGIIIVGLVISLLVLNPGGKILPVPDGEGGDKKETVAETPEAKPDKPAAAPEEKSAPGKPAEKKPAPDPKPVVAMDGFKTPDAAMKALAEVAGSKDFGKFLEFVGEASVPEALRPRLRELIEDPAFSLDPKAPFVEISKSASEVRWALNFRSGDAAKGLSISEVYADLGKAAAEDTFAFRKIALPLEIAGSAPGAKPGAPAPGDPGSKPSDPARPGAKKGAPAGIDMDAVKTADALTIAHAFSRAVVGKNFSVARALSDPATVTDERVAALMFAVEEGSFSLKQDRPLVVTLSREDITWVLTRIQSGDGTSEFALELAKVGDSWSVNGLTFSKVLASLADRAGAGDVAYSPIVEDPMGGDSLVLYFEFDASSVTPRGNRQLAIIADILSQGSERVIRINGHADALGTDEYNAELSNRRADAIRRALISMGVSPSQVVTEGFGESKPRRPNFNEDGTDNPSGRSQNRRAEVYLDF